MRVTVVAHERIRPILDEWHRSLGSTTAERNQRRRELWREFVVSIIHAKGPPPHSYEDTENSPSTFWCNFPGGGMAEILIEPDRRVDLMSYERRVIVVNLRSWPKTTWSVSDT